MRTISILTLALIFLFSCKNSKKVPSYKGSHYEQVVVTVRTSQGGWYTGYARKWVIDTANKVYLDAQHSDSVYQHYVDSFYYVPFTVRMDTVLDKDKKPVYDSTRKKIMVLAHDTTYILGASFVSEVAKKLYK